MSAGRTAAASRPDPRRPPRSNLQRPHDLGFRRSLIAALLLGLGVAGACRSTQEGPNSSKSADGVADAKDARKPVPYDPRVWDAGPVDSLGAYLSELDKSMRAWTNLTTRPTVFAK